MSSRRTLPALAIALAAAAANAQCAPQWQVDSGLGVDGSVYALLEWDPDGSGPRGMHLVVGGQFANAGPVPASNLALYDLQTGTWIPLWTGTNAPVRALAVGLAGELIVGGMFTSVDNVAARGIASYASGAWQPLGTGIDVSRNGVRCLHPQPGGQLIAGGDFGDAGGTPVDNIAAWNGTAWSALGAGLQDTLGLAATYPGEVGVRSLATTAQGLVAVGLFNQSGSTQLYSVAAWNGTLWNPIGSFATLTRPVVRSLQALPNGNLLAGGTDLFLGSFVKQWNGTVWATLTAPSAQPQALAVTPGGDWVVTGGPTFGPSLVQKWTGSGWLQLGTMASFGYARALTPLASVGPNALAMGGQFTDVNGRVSNSLAIYQPASGWLGNSRVLTATQPRVHVSPDGDVLLGGGGSQGGTPLPSFARWNGSSWTSFAGNAPAHNGLAFDDRGGIVVATSQGVMRWDGTAWSSVGTGSPAGQFEIAVLPNGNLVAADPQCHLWNGTTWQNLGAAPRHVVATSRGEIIAGGHTQSFPTSGRVARWSGTAWISLDPTFLINSDLNCMLALPDGSVVVGGYFTFGNRIARWDGTAWQTMGSGFDGNVDHLCLLGDGRVLAAGAFSQSGAVPCPGSAVWDGQSWQPLPPGPSSFLSLASHPGGDLWTITGQRELARLVTPCPAAVVPFGSACPSSGGANRLGATSWPLVGGRLTSFATGLPNLGLTAAITGLGQTSLPLSQLLPQGQSGCNLLVTPDAVAFLPGTSGQVAYSLDVPNAPQLIGVLLHHQLLTVETPALGGLGPATATNGLSMTVGSMR